MADRNHTPEPRSSQNNYLTVLSHPVRRRGDYYSLTDLHQAAGGDPAHHPERYLETPQARAWAADVAERLGGTHALSNEPRPGSRPGASVSVFARRELAQAYALWVGAGFALAVLRALEGGATSAGLDPAPHTRYDLGYVRDLRWEDDRPGDIAWWEFDGQGALTAAEAAVLGQGFLEQTRHLARTNPGDAEMALKYSLMRWLDGGFRGRRFQVCEWVFCEGLSRAAVAGLAGGGGDVSFTAPSG